MLPQSSQKFVNPGRQDKVFTATAHVGDKRYTAYTRDIWVDGVWYNEKKPEMLTRLNAKIAELEYSDVVVDKVTSSSLDPQSDHVIHFISKDILNYPRVVNYLLATKLGIEITHCEDGEKSCFIYEPDPSEDLAVEWSPLKYPDQLIRLIKALGITVEFQPSSDTWRAGIKDKTTNRFVSVSYEQAVVWAAARQVLEEEAFLPVLVPTAMFDFLIGEHLTDEEAVAYLPYEIMLGSLFKN